MGLSVGQVHSCTAAVHKIHAMKCTAPIIVYKKKCTNINTRLHISEKSRIFADKLKFIYP